ncbi:hypothetical protein D9M68_896960 [compost metagenome]
MVWLQLQISVVIVGVRCLGDGGIVVVVWQGLASFGCGVSGLGWGRCGRGGGWFLFVRIVHQFQELRTHHLGHVRSRERARLGVVVDVDVQPVHDVVARVGEEFLHRRIAHVG